MFGVRQPVLGKLGYWELIQALNSRGHASIRVSLSGTPIAFLKRSSYSTGCTPLESQPYGVFTCYFITLRRMKRFGKGKRHRSIGLPASKLRLGFDSESCSQDTFSISFLSKYRHILILPLAVWHMRYSISLTLTGL